MYKIAISALLLAAVSFAGCNSSSNALSIDTRTPPQPLPSSPSGQVVTSTLDPISGELRQSGAYDPNNPQTYQNQQQPLQDGQAPTVGGGTTNVGIAPDGSTQTASLQNSAQPLTHEPLAGSWNVASDNPDCRIILAFTKWSGGYRAATRRCLSPEIGSITAWDVKGSQVILVDGQGNTVARLYSSGNDRYDGQTTGGKPISFSR